jgi:hypothetical protein
LNDAKEDIHHTLNMSRPGRITIEQGTVSLQTDPIPKIPVIPGPKAHTGKMPIFNQTIDAEG